VHDDSITVTALGVGSDYDGLLMQHISERGGGMYGYLKDASALEEVLGKEVAAARTPAARNVVLSIDSADFTVVDAPGRHLDWRGNQQVVHLADLRPGVPTRVFVRLQSKASSAGLHPQFSASVKWLAAAGIEQRSNVSLALTVVDDVNQVNASRDEAVYARGITAVGSLQLVAAAAAYERGDVAAASSLFDSARAVFGMSADALAGQTEVDETRRAYGSASNEGRKEMGRKLERKKLSDFGRSNEGY
jgi:Ca-activated chloride channel family protein